MTHIQINTDADLHRKLNIVKAKRGARSIADIVLAILKEATANEQ